MMLNACAEAMLTMDPPPEAKHRRQGRFRHMPCAIEIDRKAALPFPGVGLQRRVKNVHTGVVDENVELSEPRQRGRNGSFSRLRIGDVAGHEHCAQILTRQARRDRLTVVASRSAMTTRAPSRTNARAIASPMPRPAPVISATFPS